MGNSGMNVSAIMASQTVLAGGQASIPAMTAGQTRVVRVTLKPSLPDVSYSPTGFVTSSGVGGLNLLGSIEVQGVAIVDRSNVDVTVKNTGLLSLSGAYANVIAVRS